MQKQSSGGVLGKKVLLENSQKSQENTCAGVSFLIKYFLVPKLNISLLDFLFDVSFYVQEIIVCQKGKIKFENCKIFRKNILQTKCFTKYSKPPKLVFTYFLKTSCRSSRPEVICEKVLLKLLLNTCGSPFKQSQSLFFNEFQVEGLQLY